MKRAAFAWFAVLLLMTGCSSGPDPARMQPIDEANSDYQTLLHAAYFAYGGVGAAGTLPEEVLAFNRLRMEDNAYLYFTSLEEHANNAGKLYALCGLYHLDFARYQSLMSEYRENEELVACMNGCIYSTKPIKQVILVDEAAVEEEDGTVVRLRDNKVDFNRWLARNCPDGAFAVDFIGGGIPNMILYYVQD